MTTPEGRIKQKITKLLGQHGLKIYRYMPVPRGYGSVTVDYLCCAYSCFLAIEAKSSKGKKPTVAQAATMRLVREAGGIAICVNDDESLAELAKILDYLKAANYDSLTEYTATLVSREESRP